MKSLVIAALSAFMFSCTYDAREDIDPATACNTNNVTYELTIVPILNRECIACHSGQFPAGGLDYENYANVQAVASDGRLAGTINHLPDYEPMPPFLPKLPECDIQKIEKWVTQGALNN